METFREYRRTLDSLRTCNNNLPNECSVARISIHNACVDRVVRVTVTIMPFMYEKVYESNSSEFDVRIRSAK